MKCTRPILWLCVCASVAAGRAGSGFEPAGDEATPWPEALRVHRVRADTLDYTFTAYSARADGAWILSLNRRDGKTFFVEPGDAVGPYRVAEFEPRAERVFVPSTQSYRTRRSGAVVLEAADGERHELEMGAPLEKEGWRATVVSLRTGTHWDVRAGDTLSVGSVALRAASVQPDEVRLIGPAREAALPFLNESETAQLQALYEQHRKKRREQERLLAQKREDAAEKAARQAWERAERRPTAREPREPWTGAAPTRAIGPLPPSFYGTDPRMYPTPAEWWRWHRGWTEPRRWSTSVERRYEGRKFTDRDRPQRERRAPAQRGRSEMAPPYATPITPHPPSPYRAP